MQFPTSLHFWGILTAVFSSISLIGLLDQIRAIIKSKQTAISKSVTQEISIGRNFLSFCGYYFKAVYSLGLPQIDYYLLLTRILGSSLTSAVIFLIFSDRKTKSSGNIFYTCLAMLLLLGGIYCIERSPIIKHFELVKIITLLADLGVAFGLWQQILRILNFKSTGSISKLLYQLLLLKELSTIGLGFAHGYSDGWPLIIAHGLLLLEELYILYLFRKFRA